MGAQGTATIDFGSTPTEETTVAVTGETGIVSGSHVEAFWMRDTTGDNDVEAHEGMAYMGNLVCGSVIAGTGFTIYAKMVMGFATGQFSVRWVWN